MTASRAIRAILGAKASLLTLRVSLGVVLLLGMAVSAYAVPITTNPVIVSGNITFFNFTCQVNGGAALTCANIDVAAHTSTTPPDATSGDFGIRINGAFNSGATAQDVIITYEATISGGALFHDASMFYNGTVVSSVDEDIFDKPSNTQIGEVFVANPGQHPTDHIILDSTSAHIFVLKDIGLNFSGTNPGTISIIDQNFSQTVPEPTTLLLLGSGILGVGLAAARRRRTVR